MVIANAFKNCIEINPLSTWNLKFNFFANIEDPDEMLQNVAFISSESVLIAKIKQS